jgi:ferredoxin
MAKVKQLPTRQRIRKAILLLSVLLFPITLYYLSPYIIIAGAAEGVISASWLVFALMLVSALFIGRLWCGWLCPAGSLQDLACSVNAAPVKSQRLRWAKWLIWVPWLSLIALLAIAAGGYQRVEAFHMLAGGLTVNQEYWFITYYIVIAVFLALPMLLGRRAGCHSIYWMAPFMIVGQRIGSLLRLPGLHLAAASDACVECGRCSRECPMSLAVQDMVKRGDLAEDECVLCGSCVDNCPKSVIRYRFRRRSVANKGAVHRTRIPVAHHRTNQ